jgi:hypothetical protein
MNASDLRAVWADLEQRLTPDAARVQRRIHPHAQVRILVWAANPGPTRSLVVEAPAETLTQVETMPEARGVLCILHPPGDANVGALELQLADQNASDVFCALAADVAEHVAGAVTPDEAVVTWLARLAMWQKLLARASQGLSLERQRGLFAELWFLQRKLGPLVGFDDAVAAWQATSNRSHDFQLRGGSIEVKSTIASQPQEVVINGERQLDETGTASLHLLHISLDVHRDSGTSLPDMVQALRSAASDHPCAPMLEDRLLEYGYLDTHEHKYRHIGYTLREHGYYRVGPGFPRLVEADLPAGVGGIRYVLAIAACAAFTQSEDTVLGRIAHATTR